MAGFLLASPEGHAWYLLWSSERPRYGGTGARHLRPDEVWVLPGHRALLLCPGAPSPNRKSEPERALEKAKGLRHGGGGRSP